MNVVDIFGMVAVGIGATMVVSTVVMIGIDTHREHKITHRAECDHKWEAIHSVDEKGVHWCPTGIEACFKCDASRHGVDRCRVYGQRNVDALGRSRDR